MPHQQVNFHDLHQSDTDAGLDTRNIRDEFKGLSTDAIRARVTQTARAFSVCAVSVTGDLNTGTIIRTAHLMGAQTVYTIGRRKFDRRGMVGAGHYQPMIRLGGIDQDTLDVDPDEIRQILRDQGLMPVMIECPGTRRLGDLDWTTLDRPPLFFVGNEGRGIPERILGLANEFNGFSIEIPTLGVLRSHNVSVALGIVLWDYAQSMGWLSI